MASSRRPLRMVVWCVLASCATLAHHESRPGSSQMDEGESPAGYEALTSADEGLRQAAVAEVRGRRTELISKLVAFIDDEKLREARPEAVADAMGLCGAFRAAEAVDVLAESITFRRPGVAPGRPPALEDYPAAAALAEIGHPSVPVLIAIVATGEEPVLRPWLASLALQATDGWEVTVLRLRLAAQDEPDAGRSTRLRAEAKRLEDVFGPAPNDARANP